MTNLIETKGLINVSTNDKGEVVVSGRDLHKGLEVKTDYRHWIKRMIDYGFIEGVDFRSFLTESTGGRPQENHILKLDMAKEIAMIQRSDKGREIRKYFIQVEKDFNTPEKIMSRALKMADDILKQTELKYNRQIEEQKPKVLFADSVTNSNQAILIGNLAKLLRQNGYEIGQNKLFKWLRDNDYLIKRKGNSYNMPTQKSMDLELFYIKEKVVNIKDQTILTRTTMVTGKGQLYFINLFLGEEK